MRTVKLIVLGAALAVLAAGCGSGSDAQDAAPAPVAATSSPAQDRTGAEEASATDCPTVDNAKQTVCGRVSANTLRFTDANGNTEPIEWNRGDYKDYFGQTNKDKVKISTTPPATFTTSAFWEYSATSLAHDMCVKVHYTGPDQLPQGSRELIMGACDVNTGGNSATCDTDGGDKSQPYIYCPNDQYSGSGNREDFYYRPRNFPVTVVIKNDVGQSVDLQSKSMSAMSLDGSFGSPSASIGNGQSGNWQAYRQTSTSSSMTLNYQVGGSSDYSGTGVQVQVQVDNNGSPAGSKCSVANKSQFDSVFCSVSVSPVVPTPTSGSASVSPADQPPVVISVQIHR